MTAGGQDEPALVAEQLGAAIAVLPRGDMVGDPGDDAGIGTDPG
jgi:hypothetical protein